MTTGDATLAFLLDLDGEEIVYGGGHTARFRVRRVPASPERPHGIVYSLTLHDPSGRRIMGFDNAHTARGRSGGRAGGSPAYDHWHRGGNDKGKKYEFVSAEKLIVDFFDEIERILKEKGQW